MNTQSQKKHEVVSAVYARLEAERELAGDFLHGIKSVAEVVQLVKKGGLLRHNIAVYLMEQSGAQPLLTTNISLPLQRKGVVRLGELACHRYFQATILDYLFMNCEEKHAKWISGVAEILATDVPLAYLKFIEVKPSTYLNYTHRWECLAKNVVAPISKEGQDAVSEVAEAKRKLPSLLKRTNWESCRERMMSGKNRRTLLSMDMGLE